ncbi:MULTISPECIES: ketol-acid reductoisomerase [Syntrophotalea]|jgi:ketol-acid reductoisomerase|uniref:Ketol-acid reductoisomerase (NADP(+)) n=1 Tax=Syntrophotalea acetylenica TaxID=29542 RepID=A0A1L3GGL9_SYNAC|nr:ketol-acid reductoisomerase [Syntrophotalea acetylenica]APG25086.1 ketol-acid reductoisomerase [Syntrophotalea acetylenica]APG43157.1 ketol-acid reductoisomerase [Syntrophotalea acetylenica]MDY0260919.1 ketol-acid reductoisomerase [Syntrophotalea acetylenica]
MGQNYFNSLPLRRQLQELGTCRFMEASEFTNGCEYVKGKKIVIVGCGAQGLNQGLNMRDSGLDVSYALRKGAIEQKRQSYLNASENGFAVGTYEEMLPTADIVMNLTPDKQHTSVVNTVVPMMKQGAVFSYAHGFNIVEEGTRIRKDLTVIMVAPKCPGTEVREEYKRGFGVPTLIAVHGENDPNGDGLEIAKALCSAQGGDRAGVLESSFVAEVKSDLMGEQTILCGMLQAGSLLCFDKMVAEGIDAPYAAKLIQYGWETVTEALKHGGITTMMDRLSNPAKLVAFELAAELKDIMRSLFEKHMDDILSGEFSRTMMEDWANDDVKLLTWREETGKTAFEQTEGAGEISEQEYFDKGILMVAMVKAGVELAFETMVSSGIEPESAYYESLHETPLIANTIARKKLYEMNRVISDTAEYGCYLFSHACVPLLQDFMAKVGTDVIGKGLSVKDNSVDNRTLVDVNAEIRAHLIEEVGEELRAAMQGMKAIV